MTSLTSGIVTFLLTDIEGSSRLWEKGSFERDFGSLEDAVTAYEESIRSYIRADHSVGAQWTAADMAVALVRLGYHDQAIALFLPNAVALLGDSETSTQAAVLVDLALGRAEI